MASQWQTPYTIQILHNTYQPICLPMYPLILLHPPPTQHSPNHHRLHIDWQDHIPPNHSTPNTYYNNTLQSSTHPQKSHWQTIHFPQHTHTNPTTHNQQLHQSHPITPSMGKGAPTTPYTSTANQQNLRIYHATLHHHHRWKWTGSKGKLRLGALNRVRYRICNPPWDCFWPPNLILPLRSIRDTCRPSLHHSTTTLLPTASTTKPCYLVVRLQQLTHLIETSPPTTQPPQQVQTRQTWSQMRHWTSHPSRLTKCHFPPSQKSPVWSHPHTFSPPTTMTEPDGWHPGQTTQLDSSTTHGTGTTHQLRSMPGQHQWTNNNSFPGQGTPSGIHLWNVNNPPHTSYQPPLQLPHHNCLEWICPSLKVIHYKPPTNTPPLDLRLLTHATAFTPQWHKLLTNVPQLSATCWNRRALPDLWRCLVMARVPPQSTRRLVPQSPRRTMRHPTQYCPIPESTTTMHD